MQPYSLWILHSNFLGAYSLGQLVPLDLPKARRCNILSAPSANTPKALLPLAPSLTSNLIVTFDEAIVRRFRVFGPKMFAVL
jgi:hypothetical protein